MKHHILKTFELGPGDEEFALDASASVELDVVRKWKVSPHWVTDQRTNRSLSHIPRQPAKDYPFFKNDTFKKY